MQSLSLQRMSPTSLFTQRVYSSLRQVKESSHDLTHAEQRGLKVEKLNKCDLKVLQLDQ